MRLSVADLPTDDRTSSTRTVWVNPGQIETVVEYFTWNELEPLLWLEITLASGTVLYDLVGPVALGDIATAVQCAIARLFLP